MHSTEHYLPSSKMFLLICQQPAMLQMMSRFDIPLGVEDKTVEQVCREHNVDPATFLAVANFLKFGPEAVHDAYLSVSVPTLVNYLKRAHEYFLDFQLPSIRRKLVEAIVSSNKREVNKVVGLIVKFYDDYSREVRVHMEHENSEIFTYVDELLKGRRRQNFSIDRFASYHKAMDEKLQELKNLIIKYYKPDTASDILNSMMYDIFECEYDLRRHCEVEDRIFIPAVRLLEQNVCESAAEDAGEETAAKGVLSEREKEIVSLVVKGLKNREIADKLFISVHTVLTHRKNICHKLNIHSVSGLTIYAIVNSIVRLEDLEDADASQRE